MYIDTRHPIRAHMNGRVKQSGAWHSGRILTCNLIIYIISGKLTLRIGDAEYIGGAGSVFLVPAGTKYVPTDASELEYLFFHFDAPDAGESDAKLIKITANRALPQGEYAYTYSLDVSPVISIPEHTETAGDRRVRELVEKITALNVWSSPEGKLLLDCYLRELLIMVSSITQSGISRNLAGILQYIEENYTKALSLTVLSDIFGFSRSYIARLFKNELNIHSSDYINKVRIGVACDLLSNSSMRVGEISEEIGFSSQYYFSRVFRQLCGVTPLEFRNKNSEPI